MAWQKCELNLKILNNHKMSRKLVGIVTADSMTEIQMIALVKEYYYKSLWLKKYNLNRKNGPFIHFRYALSRSDTVERMEELDKLKSFLDEIEWNTAHIHNVRGYFLQLLGDLDRGTMEIEKYMELYPEGYNPLDSRAEFYLFAGDTVKAIEYYEKAVEKFPFATSARNALNNLSKD